MAHNKDTHGQNKDTHQSRNPSLNEESLREDTHRVGDADGGTASQDGPKQAILGPGITNAPVVDPRSLPLSEHWQGGVGFAGSAQRLGPVWGMRHLGCRVVEIAPGQRGWPFHHHYANDEMFVIVSGQGTLRYGGQSFPVSAGQVIGCPAGDAQTAHQLINTGQVPLRYLAVSSMREPEIAHYPDSGKWGLIAGSAPGEPHGRTLSHFYTGAREADYWLDEKAPAPLPDPAERTDG